MMDLEASYAQINKKLDMLEFEKLWPGFSRCPFALYDDTQVVLGDTVFPKTDEFIANTAIRYRDEMIAIWNVSEDMNANVLASKIAHEMFHAYQMEKQEARFPNEMEALTEYEYSPAYLQLKWQENKLLAALCERFRDGEYKKFLSLRKRRREDYPYQYRYECGVEVIEGSAQHVEWQALKKLDPGLYQNAKFNCIGRIKDMHRLMPVRALCYDVGAALLDVCIGHDLPVNMCVGDSSEYLLPDSVYKSVEIAAPPAVDDAVEAMYADNIKAFRTKIITITKSNQPIAQGSFKLLGVNVFSARCLDNYIFTEYFVMYEDEEPVTLYGNYLLKMENGSIRAIYADTDT